MGGGGGGGYIGPSSDKIRRKVDEAFRREQERLDGQVDDMLQGLLTRFNSRDSELMRERLKTLGDELNDVAEVETILLGGSVAKHTAVDGLSDIDALVILDREDLGREGPGALLHAFENILSERLPRAEIRSIERGRLAVTVTYVDGTEIQLLPALRQGQTISIAAPDGKTWNDTKPRLFQRKLTQANKRLAQRLVPTIKLFKSILAGFPEQKRISGYHAEALALEVSKDYKGPKTSKALLLHTLERAAVRVLKPITDPTMQSRTIDAELGAANSVQRRSISQALLGMKRRLDAARTVEQWEAVFRD